MADEAAKALEWREEFGRGGTAVGVARARDLKNRAELSIRTIKRMFSYFSRHEVDKQAEGFYSGEDGYPSAGRIAWGLWGGDPGFSWTKRKIREIEKEEKMEDSKNVRHIQKIEETDDAYVLYFGKSQDDTMPPAQDSDKDEEYYSEEESNVSTEDKEMRTHHGDVELQNIEENSVVVGYAAVFDALSENLGGFRETINRNAFEGRLNDDVRFLINHEGMPLGRTISGTLRLSVDERGLRYEADLPNTATANELKTALKRGDITQSSFAFVVEADEWSEVDGQMRREILKVSRLMDVSAVTYPAYPDASVALRSLEDFKMAQAVEKEKTEYKAEESDLHYRSLRELKLKLINNNLR